MTIWPLSALPHLSFPSKLACDPLIFTKLPLSPSFLSTHLIFEVYPQKPYINPSKPTPSFSEPPYQLLLALSRSPVSCFLSQEFHFQLSPKRRVRERDNNGSDKPSNPVFKITLQYSLSLPSYPPISPTHFLSIPHQEKDPPPNLRRRRRRLRQGPCRGRKASQGLD